MLEPTFGEFGGLPAIERLAAEAGSWPEVAEDWQWCARFAYQVIERRGTGGGAFRLMYSRFLEEAGRDEAPLAAEAAARWTELARRSRRRARATSRSRLSGAGRRRRARAVAEAEGQTLDLPRLVEVRYATRLLMPWPHEMRSSSAASAAKPRAWQAARSTSRQVARGRARRRSPGRRQPPDAVDA